MEINNDDYLFDEGIVKSLQKSVEVPLNTRCMHLCNTIIDEIHHLSMYTHQWNTFIEVLLVFWILISLSF